MSHINFMSLNCSIDFLGHFEKEFHDPSQMRSAYHVRDFEISKLSLVCVRHTHQHFFYSYTHVFKIKQPIDIFLSHDWPADITRFGDENQLLRSKPYFYEEVSAQHRGPNRVAFIATRRKIHSVLI
jgi:lariat debranching enzyme